MFISMNLANNN